MRLFYSTKSQPLKLKGSVKKSLISEACGIFQNLITRFLGYTVYFWRLLWQCKYHKCWDTISYWDLVIILRIFPLNMLIFGQNITIFDSSSEKFLTHLILLHIRAYFKVLGYRKSGAFFSFRVTTKNVSSNWQTTYFPSMSRILSIDV